jgi:hypothetical protein
MFLALKHSLRFCGSTETRTPFKTLSDLYEFSGLREKEETDMKRLQKTMLSLVVIGLITFAISLLSTRPVGATNPQLVTVTNTSLPVQGTISVGNTPSVNVANTPSVTLANTPTVNVANMPTVNLSNTTLSVNNPQDSNNQSIPLIVSSQAPQPFQDQCFVSNGLVCYFSAPPSGMRMVIQEFDFQAGSTSAYLFAYVVTTLNSSAQYHNFLATSVGSNSLFAIHQPTTLYHDDASSAPYCSISSIVSSGQCEISGYFVPVQ